MTQKDSLSFERASKAGFLIALGGGLWRYWYKSTLYHASSC